MTSRPGTRPRPASSSDPQAARSQHNERHDHDGRRAHEPGTGLDAWIQELVEAAPPLTRQQRRTLALLLNGLAPVPARPAGAAVLDQAP